MEKFLSALAIICYLVGISCVVISAFMFKITLGYLILGVVLIVTAILIVI